MNSGFRRGGGTEPGDSAPWPPVPSPEQLVGVDFVLGAGGLECSVENLDSLCLPIQVPEGGGTGHRGAPPPDLTITHTPGAPPGSWAGQSKRVAVDLFSVFLFVLSGDAFLVFYTIRQSPRDSYEFCLKTLSLYLL